MDLQGYHTCVNWGIAFLLALERRRVAIGVFLVLDIVLIYLLILDFVPLLVHFFSVLVALAAKLLLLILDLLIPFLVDLIIISNLIVLLLILKTFLLFLSVKHFLF